jgi:hypothetical protein
MVNRCTPIITTGIFMLLARPPARSNRHNRSHPLKRRVPGAHHSICGDVGSFGRSSRSSSVGGQEAP